MEYVCSAADVVDAILFHVFLFVFAIFYVRNSSVKYGIKNHSNNDYHPFNTFCVWRA